MRRLALIPLAAAGLGVAAPAASPPLLSVSPRAAHVDDAVTIRGREWPVIESAGGGCACRLESDQNAMLIGFVRIRDNGRFTPRWTPESDKVGPGRWRIVARLRCDSGQDGSPNFITRRRQLRILL